jgi:WD40 repeat protein
MLPLFGGKKSAKIINGGDFIMRYIFKFILDNHSSSRARYLLLVLLLYGCATTSLQKPVQDFSQTVLAKKPILTIDTGGHKAQIQDLMFTSDGRYLVSASTDKTVRVWDVSTGEVVRILRGQIGRGHEGMIYAAALSPDDRLLAVGGWFDKDSAPVPCCGNIRLIDFHTGEVQALLKGHSNVIDGLAFSPDGTRLISGSADRTARIWDVRSRKTLHVLEGHKDSIYAVAFSPDGSRAVTGSFDHTLRLWDAKSGTLIKPLEGHDEGVKFAAFTPDGKYVLSGSYDKTIRLWDARTGKFIKVLATQNRGVLSLSTTPDSKYVLSGIGDPGRGGNQCRVFSVPSGEKITTFTKHDNVVLATAVSPDGKTAATAGGNNFPIYLWDINTGSVEQKMVGNGDTIWSVGFAEDGRSIAWGKTYAQYNLFSRGPLEQAFQIKGEGGAFDLSMGRELKGDTGYLRAVESVGAWSIRTKNGMTHPTLQILKNGHVEHEITRDSTDGYDHRSLTLTPDGKTVISGGSNGFLTSYNPETGRKVHDFVGHTGDVWAVAVSPDSRYVVSGSYDQTVRLWEIATGKPLLTIFQGTDNEWVAWTRDGFYAASPGGEGYVGYHINRGEEKAADYVSVAQVGDLFYRPDLVAKRIQGGFEQEIQAELARIGSIDEVIASGLPPLVTILSKGDIRINKRDFTLNFSLEDKGGGVGRIEYRVNGAVVAHTEAARAVDFLTRRRPGKIPKELTLSHGKNTIEVIARNKRGNIAGKPVQITVEVDDPLKDAPSLYVLAVGISDYRDQALQLKFAHKDAQDIASELELRGKGLFRGIHVTPLLNDDATTAAIKNAFESLSKTVKTSDVFVLCLMGHGMAIEGNYHFIPWEAVYENIESLKEASISHEKIESLLEKIPALKSLIVLDTCYAGLLAEQSRGMVEKTAIERLMRSTGRAFLAATSKTQYAIEGYKKHGVFTYALLEGLKGKADRPGEGKGVIRIDELGEFVRWEVPKITKEKWGFEQIPMRRLTGDSFEIGCCLE